MTASAYPFDLPSGDVVRLLAGRHDRPFDILGPHQTDEGRRLVAFLPSARTIHAITTDGEQVLQQVENGLFAGLIPEGDYQLSARGDGWEWRFEDPYRFDPVLGPLDLHLIAEGRHENLWHALGAHVMQHQGVAGTHFAVWAPHAQRVSVVGAFNNHDGRRHPMQRRDAGVWEIFLPGIGEPEAYDYEIISAQGLPMLKADPLGFGAQHPPQRSSVVRDITGYGWRDGDWMAGRGAANDRAAPISIYEVHVGSWRRRDGRSLSWRELAVELVDYVRDMGFTHIELMPISEYPFEGSWGYQPVGLYAPTIRFGPPHEFRDLIDAAHLAGLGVILDWVPGHFPSDPHGLARFDGTALYEHDDPREGFHQDWNTLIYDHGRPEVRNFLIANALYWMEEYHIDGLRVDAVASMLYRDYSRRPGEWIPNRDGGRENYEAIAFLKDMNTVTYGRVPGIMTVAEESTSFPGVSAPVDAGGLGFGFKWNMGWMNDTLRYISADPLYRRYHHDQMTFGLVYAFAENFILPISHDEVVHGKGSMLGKMPGDDWQRFANLRAYYAFMWCHPGKKLLFMGCELALPEEWNHDGQLNWGLLDRPAHRGVQALVRDLNRLYRETPALHARDSDPGGFQWLRSDAEQSVLAWLRHGAAGDSPVLVVCNFTPVERQGFDLGVPATGLWREVLNTDAEVYGGAGKGNLGGVTARPEALDGQPARVTLTLPALSVQCFILKS